jgi:glycosyltransferase involved in cell wall biosynthesis
MKIAFLDMSTKLHTVNDLQTRARGGMVSSLFAVSDGLAGLGHEVMVFSDIRYEGVTLAGTTWINSKYEGTPFDVLVTNRGVGNGYPEIKARRRILWTHDLPHNGFIREPKTMAAFDATVFMSRYAERVWRTFYKTIGKSFLIPNGVDRDTFYPREKNPDYLIYISNPNRGFNRLPLIYEATKNRLGRDIKMRAYSNSAVLHPNEGDCPDFSMNYRNCQDVGIEVFDPVPQRDLSEELGRAGAMVLPTMYPEICSNAVLQSLACGTPIFTTGGLGSALEWISHGKNGMLTKYMPHDYMVYQVEMVRNLIDVLSNPRAHRKMMANAAQTKGIITWKQVVKLWSEMLARLS